MTEEPINEPKQESRTNLEQKISIFGAGVFAALATMALPYETVQEPVTDLCVPVLGYIVAATLLYTARDKK